MSTRKVFFPIRERANEPVNECLGQVMTKSLMRVDFFLKKRLLNWFDLAFWVSENFQELAFYDRAKNGSVKFG